MATLLRPPLVSDRRQKRPIGYADVPPNLIASTLRITVLSLLPPLSAEQLDDSSPPRKKQVQVDLTPNLLCSTLFATTQRAAPIGPEQWDDSAPQRFKLVTVDVFPNLLGTTLGNVTPPATLDPPLLFRQLDASAPSRHYINQVEQLARQVWTDPVPAVAQLSDSATPRKRQTRIDTTPNPVVLLQPLIRSWFESAPPRMKMRVMLDLYSSPNTTRLVPLAALAKPLGYPYDFSTPQKKYAVRFEPVQNILARGIPLVAPSSILETIPYLIGSVESQARQMLGSIYMTVVVVGSGGTVISQDVDAFTLAPRGTTVTITMGGATYSPRGSSGPPPYNLH